MSLPRRASAVHRLPLWWAAAWITFASLPVAAAPKVRGAIAIECAESGAEVTLDGSPVGTTPIEPIQTMRGEHQVAVRKGTLDFKRTVTVTAGETVVVKVPVAEVAAAATSALPDLDLDFDLPPAPATEAPAPASRRRPKRPSADTPAPPPAAAVDDLPDLALEFDLPPDPPPMPTAPTVTAATVIAPPTAISEPPPLQAAPSKPRLFEPPPVAPPAPASAFVVPLDERPSKPAAASAPIYQRPWFWAAVGTATVAAVVVPLLVMGSSDPGYVEVRDPATACPSCALVLNP